MQPIFEELDYQNTPHGEISLRRRTEPKADNQLVYEVKLGDEFLMSSLFVEAEEQLSKCCLAELKNNGHTANLRVVVGGLGLGYTALAALADDAVCELEVIDVMQPVIDWHRRGLLPMGTAVAEDPRCTLTHADFFALATASSNAFSFAEPVHAVLLDIDHSPSHWLNESNQSFYDVESLSRLATKIIPGGVFGLWSNEKEDAAFTARLSEVFDQVNNVLVEFSNPYSDAISFNSVYTGVKR